MHILYKVFWNIFVRMLLHVSLHILYSIFKMLI